MPQRVVLILYSQSRKLPYLLMDAFSMGMIAETCALQIIKITGGKGVNVILSTTRSNRHV